MARKLIDTLQHKGAHEMVAKIYRDPEFDEFQVELFCDGVHLKDATYYTDDKEDATATAHHMLRS